MQMRTMPVLQAMVLRHATVQLDMKEFRVKVSEAAPVHTLSLGLNGFGSLFLMVLRMHFPHKHAQNVSATILQTSMSLLFNAVRLTVSK